MHEVIELPRKTCNFTVRTMITDQPYSEVVRTHMATSPADPSRFRPMMSKQAEASH
jgi:hypothetical protein